MKLSVTAVAAVILAAAIVANANAADTVDRVNQCVDLNQVAKYFNTITILYYIHYNTLYNQLCPALKDRLEQLEERLNQVIAYNPINPVPGNNNVPEFGSYRRR